ncbi:MAG: hypothetical protein AABX48_02560 [Nanoarchaeota archaeon]
MKKGILITIIFYIILIQPMILADNLTPQNNLPTPQQVVSNGLNATNNALSSQITIPQNLEIPARLVFGLTLNDKLDIQTFIILICLWIFLFLILRNIVQFIPSFEGASSWIGAVVLTTIFSATGILKSITLFFLDIGDNFGLIAQIGPLKLVLYIIGIIVLFYLINIIIGIIKESVIMGRAVSDGIKAGTELAKLKTMAEVEQMGSGI